MSLTRMPDWLSEAMEQTADVVFHDRGDIEREESRIAGDEIVQVSIFRAGDLYGCFYYGSGDADSGLVWGAPAAQSWLTDRAGDFQKLVGTSPQHFDVQDLPDRLEELAQAIGDNVGQNQGASQSMASCIRALGRGEQELSDPELLWCIRAGTAHVCAGLKRDTGVAEDGSHVPYFARGAHRDQLFMNVDMCRELERVGFRIRTAVFVHHLPEVKQHRTGPTRERFLAAFAVSDTWTKVQELRGRIAQLTETVQKLDQSKAEVETALSKARSNLAAAVADLNAVEGGGGHT